MTVDVQAVAPFFWWVVREWLNGSSKLVASGRADDYAAIRRVQVQLLVHDMDVGIDSGFSTQSVYDACAQWSQTAD